jgi:hypothetical protein
MTSLLHLTWLVMDGEQARNIYRVSHIKPYVANSFRYYSVVRLTDTHAWYRTVDASAAGLIEEYSLGSPHLPEGIIEPEMFPQMSVLPIKRLVFTSEFRRRITHGTARSHPLLKVPQTRLLDYDRHYLGKMINLTYHERLAIGIA